VGGVSAEPGDEEDKHQILATASLAMSDGRALKHDETFAVFDRYGDIRSHGVRGAQGLYHDGVRFLSSLRLRLSGHRPLLLSSTVRENNVMLAVDLMNPDIIRGGELSIAHGTLHLLRSKFLWRGACYEHLQISNYGMSAVDVELALDFEADFVDVFEVRGSHRARRGTLHEPERQGSAVLLAYTGLDGLRRTTRLEFAPEPTQLGTDGASFSFQLEARQAKDLYLTQVCEVDGSAAEQRVTFETAYAGACGVISRHYADDAAIATSSEQFNDWLSRSIADLHMMITATQHGQYPYAGVPWFSAPFGRDGIITALELSWVNPRLARGVLEFLAATQARELDPTCDAEPGKIIHEMRRGEMAALGEIPFGCYYGSVDSTPLFIMLAAAYHEFTGDTQTIARLWPSLELALGWIEQWGDCDGDGFIEYSRRSNVGLIQQGWKDSHDSVFHADGTAAQGPIALCEVQGYVYAARQGAARLASALGQGPRARALESAAEGLREQFDAAYWCEDLQTYALALDGAKRPCRVRSSNAGHCLFTGIAKPERAHAMAEQLLSEQMFSGWGVRTLSARERRYNPLSYHNGSVWPHDNALIGAGLARYGRKEHASRILTGLFNASEFVDLRRLPELFCGLPRRPGEGPTLYPVACSPQAWAAGAPFLLLGAVLGMSVDGAAQRVSFREPLLPQFLDEVNIRGLQVGAQRVDLSLRRHAEDVGVNVLGSTGPVEVLTIK
jgi:glycogen debranching enzyme